VVGERVEIEFRYGLSQEQSSIPAEWTITIRSPDLASVDRSTVAQVKRWDILREIADAEFDLRFPPGTIVWDYQNKVDDVPSNYLIRADGSHRPITQKERAEKVRLSTLMTSVPDVDDLRKPSSNLGKLLIANIVVLFLAIGALVWRVKSRQRGREPNV
jgi:hypothetical protein